AIEELLVANLHAISKVAWEPAQERIQNLDEFAHIAKQALCKPAEFENQRGDFIPVWLERPQKPFAQKLGIQARRNLESALRSIPRMGRKQFARNLFRNLEGKLEHRRDLLEQPTPELLTRELVESEIATYRGERLRVFIQALRFKDSLRKPSGFEVAGR